MPSVDGTLLIGSKDLPDDQNDDHQGNATNDHKANDGAESSKHCSHPKGQAEYENTE